LVLDAETSVGYIVLTFGYSLEFLGRDAFIDVLSSAFPPRPLAGKRRLPSSRAGAA
jgi:hypothetical protein